MPGLNFSCTTLCPLCAECAPLRTQESDGLRISQKIEESNDMKGFLPGSATHHTDIWPYTEINTSDILYISELRNNLRNTQFITLTAAVSG